ncbi:DUF3558 domain-containing protein [Streptomyces fumanus]|uniref:DUF3558 domain-containing protein n=1 Tax=Streptomyces fumanus TaxID=67302 RepID=A0A919E8Y6_9ACTN|nr:DUF3558 domain-containing protein [Streptomyces fumanus]GHF26377.1 hypothetical protein GCM10018772_60020 [Streptomyces fumanus]
MQRKAYVSGAAALLAALLTSCTGGSGDGGTTDDSNPGGTGATTAAAQPGKYRTLPDPCRAVGRKTLDALLPGLPQITDEERREKAYAGEATLTYDTDRKVGCRWKVDSTDATDHLLVDFERVVSYDNAVSDDSQAEQLFATKQDAADLPEPVVSETETRTATDDETGTDDGTATDGKTGTDDGSGTGSNAPSPQASASTAPSSSSSGSPTADAASGSPSSPGAAPTDLQPRLLEGLGDEAFLDDELNSSGSTAERRTVTVAFRTSNVIVTIEYTEQPTTVGVVPDSEELQDRARTVAAELADALGG